MIGAFLEHDEDVHNPHLKSVWSRVVQYTRRTRSGEGFDAVLTRRASQIETRRTRQSSASIVTRTSRPCPEAGTMRSERSARSGVRSRCEKRQAACPAPERLPA